MSQVVPQACRGALSLAALALALGFGPAAHAAPISYTFNGLVTQSSNAAVANGATFTGTIKFDSSLPTIGSTTSTTATYGDNGTGPLDSLKVHADFGGSQNFDSTTGGPRSITLENNVSLPSLISASGTQSFDKVTFLSANGSSGPSFMMSLGDNSAQLLSSTDLAALPDLAKFPSSGTYVHLQGSAGDVYGYITGISNVTPALEQLSVPEPSSLAIVGLGMAGLYGIRRRASRRP